MAAPSYTEDLTDLDLAEATTNWAESTDANWDDGSGGPDQDGDTYIEGSNSISQQMTKASICSLLANNGSDTGGHGTDGAFLVWAVFTANNAIDSYANGGVRVMVGSSLADFYSWDVGGNDRRPYPLGGWYNYAVNTSETPDDTVGTPGAAEQYVGNAFLTTAAISKGNPHCVDAIRYGRCSSIFTEGDAGGGGPATFAGFATQDVSSRWGLFYPFGAGYLWKGRMQLGTSGTAVYFVDSNVSILVDDTPKCSSGFNLIEVNNASSDVTWTNVIITALGTQSPGTFNMNANASLAWDGCQFEGMGDFTFGGSNSAALNCQWRSCGQIDAAGAQMTGSSISGYEGSTDSAALVWNVATDPQNYLDDMTFVKGTAATHAIEFGTSSPLTMTLDGNTFSGYNGSDGQNDSALYIARTSGTVNITITNGSAPSYKSAGATVNIITGTVTVKVTAKDIETLLPIQNARVLLEADSGGDLYFEAGPYLLTRSGTQVDVSHTSHGLSTGDYVKISGASAQEYNGIFQITVTDPNTYYYTVVGSPASPGSGYVTSVILYGLTDVNGIVQDTTFSYTSDQPVTGKVRKGTTSPLYKTSPLAESILSTGYAVTVFLVPDE